MLAGLDARSANITSSVALYPGQVATGVSGRSMVAGTSTLSFRAMAVIGLIGGALGSALLLLTPGATFEGLLPWLVLFATAMFGWSAFGRAQTKTPRQPVARWVAIVLQGTISVYGGYFGGGLGFLMVASLSLVGLTARAASANKNALAAVINTSSLIVFLFSPGLVWVPALLLAAGAVAGGVAGSWMLRRVPERALRIVVMCIGMVLTIALFIRAY